MESSPNTKNSTPEKHISNITEEIDKLASLKLKDKTKAISLSNLKAKNAWSTKKNSMSVHFDLRFPEFDSDPKEKTDSKEETDSKEKTDSKKKTDLQIAKTYFIGFFRRKLNTFMRKQGFIDPRGDENTYEFWETQRTIDPKTLVTILEKELLESLNDTDGLEERNKKFENFVAKIQQGQKYVFELDCFFSSSGSFHHCIITLAVNQ